MKIMRIYRQIYMPSTYIYIYQWMLARDPRHFVQNKLRDEGASYRKHIRIYGTVATNVAA
jgi:hypothetical protein